MATRKIRPSRKTRQLLPFSPQSAEARSYRPTEVLSPMPPAEPEPVSETPPTAGSGSGITIESEPAFPDAPPSDGRRRHQSLDNLQLEKKSKRQTRNLAGRGWT